MPFCTPWLTALAPPVSDILSVPINYSTTSSCPRHSLFASGALQSQRRRSALPRTPPPGQPPHRATSSAHQAPCAASSATQGPTGPRLPATRAGSPAPLAPRRGRGRLPTLCAALSGTRRKGFPLTRRLRAGQGAEYGPPAPLTSPRNRSQQGPGRERPRAAAAAPGE